MKKITILIPAICLLGFILFKKEKNILPALSTHREKTKTIKAPSQTSRKDILSHKKEYLQSLTQTLKAGMPQKTSVEIDYIDSFFEKGERKDILLIKTSFPDGRQYAYRASYQYSTKTIIRTWGGHHDGPLNDKFSYNP